MALFQANSDTLKEVADLFRNQSELMREALQNFTSVAEDMRGYGWIGLGADTFYDQYDTELVPEAEKLIQNLENAAAGVDSIVNTIEDGIQLILAKAKAPI
jgi:WXG100 family type VII secretion target